jgi:alpha-galactosidase
MIEDELVPRFTNEADHWFDYARTGGYLRHCHRRLREAEKEYAELREGVGSLPTERTHEYGWLILEAIETNQPARVNGNVPNNGLIDNLPDGCCVEVPCLVDGNGIQPTKVGWMPPQLAALNRTQTNVQELIVEASLTGEVDAVFHAVALDPLTSAVCTLPQIHDMVDEMLEAQSGWLPQFQNR